MDADPPEPASSAHTSSAIALARAYSATAMQGYTSRMHRSASNCLNRVFPLATADQVTNSAALIVRSALETPPSRIINMFAGNRDRPSQKTLLAKKELQAVTAQFGARAEPMNFQVHLLPTSSIAIMHGIRIYCPSLVAANEANTALLMEAVRPGTRPKFALGFGKEMPTPEPRPPSDPTGQ